jgi:transcriptional regulator with XRE-family HTH domain/tetratricopeptide (TPR) repeat protein
VARPGRRGSKAERDALRQEMLLTGCSLEMIASEIERRWGLRPREAYRHAHGWSQDEVAARFTEVADRISGARPGRDGRTTPAHAPMIGTRIGEYERWPSGGRRPSPYVLTVLATVLDTTVERLLDYEDHRRMPDQERTVLAAVLAATSEPVALPPAPARSGQERRTPRGRLTQLEAGAAGPGADPGSGAPSREFGAERAGEHDDEVAVRGLSADRPAPRGTGVVPGATEDGEDQGATILPFPPEEPDSGESGDGGEDSLGPDQVEARSGADESVEHRGLVWSDEAEGQAGTDPVRSDSHWSDEADGPVGTDPVRSDSLRGSGRSASPDRSDYGPPGGLPGPTHESAASVQERTTPAANGSGLGRQRNETVENGGGSRTQTTDPEEDSRFSTQTTDEGGGSGARTDGERMAPGRVRPYQHHRGPQPSRRTDPPYVAAAIDPTSGDAAAAARRHRRERTFAAGVGAGRAPTGKDVIFDAAGQSAEFGEWAEGTNVGETTLEQLDDDVRRISRDYLTNPPLPLMLDAIRVRNRAFTLLEGRQHPNQSRLLYLTAGRLCGLLAWMASDVGRHAEADTQARTAWLCAELAGADGLRAWVRAIQSKVAYWDGRLEDSAQLARDGLRFPAPGTAHVLLASLSARSWARLGAADEAHAALHTAEQERDRAGSDEVGGLLGFSEAQQSYMAGSTHLWLKEPQEALAAADRAIWLFDVGSQSTRFYGAEMLALVDAAAALTQAGDLDGAAERLRPVLELPPEQQLDTFTSRLVELRDGLRRSRYAMSRPAVEMQRQIEEFRAGALGQTLSR